jgi:hypothetical protein
VLRNRDQLPATPEAAVSALFDAASRGDDAIYLKLLAGDLRRSLEDSRSQMGVEAFRKGLKQSTAGLKAVATSAAGATGDQTLLDVDLVFADRNERQSIALAPKDNGWQVVSISAAVFQKPDVLYGTPVFGDDGAPTKTK